MNRAAPTVDEVARILAVSDRVLRNLWITQCYHALASAYAQRVAGAANWCTFATWASKQAGQTIRGEDARRALERVLGDGSPATAALSEVAQALRAIGARAEIAQIRRLMREIIDVDAMVETAGAAVARGNAKVFEEIGREFARFLEACASDASFEETRIAEFVAGLRLGEPPDGQILLRQAFPRYYRALFEADAGRRAQQLLLANLEVGLHEQTRLQPEIREALDAAVPEPEEIAPRLLRELTPWAGWLPRARRFLQRLLRGPTPLDRALSKLLQAVRAELRLVLTDQLMTLALPRGVVLRLGHDLPDAFPVSLGRLDDPELLALLARIDPTPDSVRESGARDWADLHERMHFIADLFRCRHEATELFDTPFTAAQLEELRAGRRPADPL